MSQTLSPALQASAPALTTTEGHACHDPLYQRLMAWQFEPLVERLVEKEGFDEPAAREVFVNVKQFIYLSHTRAGEPGARMSPPEPIDRAWHAFILFTRVYARFCHEHFGTFMHHTPYTREQRTAMRGDGRALKTVRATIAAAQDAFGALGPHWLPQLLRASPDRFASSCESCAGSTNCGGNDPSCW